MLKLVFNPFTGNFDYVNVSQSSGAAGGGGGTSGVARTDNIDTSINLIPGPDVQYAGPKEYAGSNPVAVYLDGRLYSDQNGILYSVISSKNYTETDIFFQLANKPENGQIALASYVYAIDGTFMFLDTSLGSGDNIVVNFNLGVAPKNPSQVKIYIDGVKVQQANFSIVGTVITMAFAPAAGQSLAAIYQVDIGTPSLFDAKVVVPTGVIDGTNRNFVISNNPADKLSVNTFVNGLLQPPGAYDLISKTISFQNGLQPIPGQSLEIEYFYAV